MTAAESPYPVGVPGFAGPVRPVLSVVAGDVADGALDVEELGSRIVGLAGRLAAATCRWLLLVAAFDARGGCARFGLATTARWLSHYCGLSRRTAMEHVRVARALMANEALAAAMGSGRLSFSQARAISRIADAGDGSLVEELIAVAEHGSVGHLELVVRGLRTVDRNARGGDVGEPEPEYLSHRWGGDSRWRLNARLDPENGALVQSAIETVAAREGVTYPQALTRIAEIALAATVDGTGQLPTLRGDEHAAVLIHLDASAVPTEPAVREQAAPAQAEAGSGEPHGTPGSGEPHCQDGSGERCRPYGRIADGPGLPDRVIKRLLCSGRIRTARHDRDGSLLDLGRSHRVVTPHLFRALLLRDGGCAHPGCGRRHGLEAHHVRHWLHGGRTDLANLVVLCRAHHHAHHDNELIIIPLGRGRFRFLRADGRELPQHPSPPEHTDTTTPIEDEHPDL
ncbi:MAG: hypothetical protein QOF92_2433, partial [Pseudonocardiales bacterium]|nr:hypothetical protein [Pseudonocardiales bacterium]